MSFARQEQRLILSDLSDAEGIVDRPRHPDKRHHELSKAHERADNDGGSAHIAYGHGPYGTVWECRAHASLETTGSTPA